MGDASLQSCCGIYLVIYGTITGYLTSQPKPLLYDNIVWAVNYHMKVASWLCTPQSTLWMQMACWHQAICIHNAVLKSNDAKQMMINTQGNVYQDLRYMAFIRMFTTEWYQNIDEEQEPVLMP